MVILKILLSLIVTVTLSSNALAEDNSLYLQIHGVSKHFASSSGCPTWNETNTGLGLRYKINSVWSIEGGQYKNSEAKCVKGNGKSNYLLVDWTPYSLGGFNHGVFGGVVDGYKRAPNGTPVAGFVSRLDYKSTSLTIRYLPPVADVTPVISLTFGIKF